MSSNRKKISLNISEIAFVKTIGLIDAFDGEVGWHGTVKRADKYTFSIEDIFVYPQTASAVSIDTEQFEYEKWLMTREDEIFNNLRMHGHSHVNFGVAPSSKDDKHREVIVEKLSGDMFYIFMIWNKSLKINTRIYDCAPKLLYTGSSIELTAIIDGKRHEVNEKISQKIKSLPGSAEAEAFIREARSYVRLWKDYDKGGVKLEPK